MFYCFCVSSYIVCATASESHLSMGDICWLGKCKVSANKMRSTPWNNFSICTPISSLFTPHRACSIIPCIGLFGPRAPRERRVGKFECCRRKIWPHARRHACLLPWPPCTMAIVLTCMLVVWAWGLHLGPTWSPPGPCALVARLNDLHSLRTWATLRWDTRLPPGRRFVQLQAIVAWRWQPWRTTSFGLTITLC
jgi:hypothetical protein